MSMEIATHTRLRPGPDVARPPGAAPRRRVTLGWLAFGALCAGTLVGFLVYPTYPNYDSYYSLLWGREVLHGVTPSFDVYRTPTEHPLAIAFGALLALLGDGGDRTLVAATLIAFVALAAGLYRLARAAFGPLVGLAAAGLLCTRFDFPFLAARAYIDIPYLAFVVWAAALEAERPRRGVPVLVLLTLAGLMRPEAWLLAGLYFLWIAWPAGWTARAGLAALTAAAPLIWVAVDYAVTGHPLFSLQHTSGLAEELGRQRRLADVPSATVQFLKSLDKVPVFYAGILGAVVALVLAPRRMAMPVALLAIGLGTFVLVGVAGLSVIDRYLLVPSLMVMIFAAVTVAGWSMLQPGRLRVAWIGAAALLVTYGVLFTATRVNFTVFDSELTFRGTSHAGLERVLRDPRVQAVRTCGAMSTPNHKLIPEVRWVLNAGAGLVIARSDKSESARERTGSALIVTNRSALLRQTLADPSDDPLDNIPPDGFTPVVRSTDYSVYARC